MHIGKLLALFHPEQYHGWGNSRKYFEGWYYKVVNQTENKAFAFIPGIAMGLNGEKHAFIQVLDGKRCTSDYITFPAQEFVPKLGKFEVAISTNSFSDENISLRLPDIRGDLRFVNRITWPNSWYSPGIMGPFSFVPFMQCNHGILSMDHEVHGLLEIKGERVDFTNGKGYMEKDWGHSFPNAYIWMQSNHFSHRGIALKVSVATIPWLGSSFIGFIAGVWIKDRLIQFTTYNISKLKKSTADEKKVEVVLENSSHRLEVLAHRETSGILASPVYGFMNGRIEESMTAKIDVRLLDKKKGLFLLEDTGRNAGLEVAGNIKEITI